MIDESRKAMIEYAIKEYQENQVYSIVVLEGRTPDHDIHQIANFTLMNGCVLVHKHGKQTTLYPLSALAKIMIPEQ